MVKGIPGNYLTIILYIIKMAAMKEGMTNGGTSGVRPLKAVNALLCFHQHKGYDLFDLFRCSVLFCHLEKKSHVIKYEVLKLFNTVLAKIKSTNARGRHIFLSTGNATLIHITNSLLRKPMEFEV